MRLAVTLLVAGSFVVALPDDGPRLFSISRDHGPSLVDAVGIGLVLAGWATAAGHVWRRRERVERRLRPAGIVASAAAFVAGLALTAWAVTGDHGSWWVAGVALAAAPQAAALAATR